MMTKAAFKVSYYLVILVDGLHAGAAGGAAVLGVLGHGDHMLHPILVDLLQRGLSEWPETKYVTFMLWIFAGKKYLAYLKPT